MHIFANIQAIKKLKRSRLLQSTMLIISFPKFESSQTVKLLCPFPDLAGQPAEQLQ
jgi:hypothetical protein